MSLKEQKYVDTSFSAAAENLHAELRPHSIVGIILSIVHKKKQDSILCPVSYTLLLGCGLAIHSGIRSFVPTALWRLYYPLYTKKAVQLPASYFLIPYFVFAISYSLWPRQESNLDLELRKLLYYPLYYEANMSI